jgi:uncharacterized membrane protein HdeD (DUF308 family)
MSTILQTIDSGIKNWWLFLIKGLLMIVAGVAIFVRPAEGYVGLSILFTVIIISSGLMQIFFAIANQEIMRGWGWTLVSGILDLAIGIYLAVYPVVTLATLPFFLGFWLIFRSFYLMGASFDLSGLGQSGWGWLFFGGILVLISGFVILYYPAAGAVSIVAFSGSGFLIGGIFYIILAFKLKGVRATAKEYLGK